MQVRLPRRAGSRRRRRADGRRSLFISNDASNVVSHHHCEVYVVVYDEAVSHVYVRDRKSSNGTFVNDVCIGSAADASPGYLLEDGDAIGIRPYWTLTLCDQRNPLVRPMSPVQEAECKVGETHVCAPAPDPR